MSDIELKVECLRLACGLADAGDVIILAKEMFEFLKEEE